MAPKILKRKQSAWRRGLSQKITGMRFRSTKYILVRTKTNDIQ